MYLSSIIYNIFLYIKSLEKIGFSNTFLIIKNRFFNKKESTVKIVGDVITYRPFTSDEKLIKNIFIDEEYNFDVYMNDHNIYTIIDAGANIGLASLYFASLFPFAKIISLEPENSNFDILKKNSSNQNIIPIKKGLRNKSTNLIVEDLRGTGKRGFQVREYHNKSKAKNIVQSIDIESLIKEFLIEKIDILKIDIEGSEKELFEGNTSRLNKVRFLIIEHHERYKKGSALSFFHAIKEFDYKYYEKGENILIHFYNH